MIESHQHQNPGMLCDNLDVHTVRTNHTPRQGNNVEIRLKAFQTFDFFSKFAFLPNGRFFFYFRTNNMSCVKGKERKEKKSWLQTRAKRWGGGVTFSFFAFPPPPPSPPRRKKGRKFEPRLRRKEEERGNKFLFSLSLPQKEERRTGSGSIQPDEESHRKPQSQERGGRAKKRVERERERDREPTTEDSSNLSTHTKK